MRLLPISQLLVVASLFLIPAMVRAQALPQSEPPQVILSLEDQFERSQNLAQYRGDVLVLLYGDRTGMPANKEVGERLHVYYHPTAKGKSQAEANKAPATPVPNLAQGMRSPDVRIVPVACIGKVPDLVKDFIRGRVKKEAPDTLVLLDFENKMKAQFGMKDGEPNLVVIDSQGRLRMKVAGEMDQASYARVLRAIDYLRQEGAK